jgi:hypothetical protein
MHDINALEIHLMRMQHWRSVTGDRSMIVRGEMPEPAVFEDWLRARLGPDLDQTTVHLEPNHDDPDRFTFRGRSYRLQRLYGSGPGAPVVGVLLLSEETLFRIPPKVLQVIADRLLAGAAHDTAHVTDATDATDATDSMTHPR